MGMNGGEVGIRTEGMARRDAQYALLAVILLVGIGLSMASLLTGMALYAFDGETDSMAAFPLDSLLPGLFSFQAPAFMMLGLSLLLGTPVAGACAVSIFAVRLRDRLFAVVSLTVMVVLAVSVALAVTG